MSGRGKSDNPSLLQFQCQTQCRTSLQTVSVMKSRFYRRLMVFLFIVSPLFGFAVPIQSSPSRHLFAESAVLEHNSLWQIETSLALYTGRAADSFSEGLSKGVNLQLSYFPQEDRSVTSYSRPLFAGAAKIRRRSRGKRKAETALRPQYKNCQDTDLSSLKFKQGLQSEGGFCFSCKVKNIWNVWNINFESLNKSNEALQLKEFREKLRKRVTGKIHAKLFKIRLLRVCLEKDRKKQERFFTPLVPHSSGFGFSSGIRPDGPLIQAVCRERKKALHASVQARLPDLRIDLALSSVNADQIVTGRPNLSHPLTHAVSGFVSLPKLRAKERRMAMKRLADYLAKTDLEGYGAEEFRGLFLRGAPLKKLTGKDQARLRRAVWKFQKKAKARYFQAIHDPVSDTPLLGYLKSDTPNDKELAVALGRVETHLEDSLKKIRPKRDIWSEEVEDPEEDMALLLSFKPLVEELLKEEKRFCFVAEKARVQADREERFKKYASIGAGVLAAGACFITGPVGASVCLAAGAGLGFVGYKQVKSERDSALGRVLMGKEFETIGGLEKKERELFLTKLFLPLSAYGTTAVPARAAGGAIARSLKGPKTGARGKGGETDNQAGQTGGSSKQVSSGENRQDTGGNRRTDLSLPEENFPPELFLRTSKQEEEVFRKAWRIQPESEAGAGGIKYYTEAQLEELKKIFGEGGLSKGKIQQFMSARFRTETNRLPNIAITEDSLARFMNQHEKSGGIVREKFEKALMIANRKHQYLIKRSNGAKLYHGAPSPSLLAFTALKSKGGLRGGHELEYPEFKDGGGPALLNNPSYRERLYSLSTVKITDIDVAITYSTKASSDKMKFTEEEIKPLLGAVPVSSVSLKDLKFIPWDKLSERDSALISEEFPVLYGLKPKNSRAVNPQDPDISLFGSGAEVDVFLDGGADFDEIVSIFVPYDKVPLVEKIIKERNLPITVSAIEPIQKPGFLK